MISLWTSYDRRVKLTLMLLIMKLTPPRTSYEKSKSTVSCVNGCFSIFTSKELMNIDCLLQSCTIVWCFVCAVSFDYGKVWLENKHLWILPSIVKCTNWNQPSHFSSFFSPMHLACRGSVASKAHQVLLSVLKNRVLEIR